MVSLFFRPKTMVWRSEEGSGQKMGRGETEGGKGRGVRSTIEEKSSYSEGTRERAGRRTRASTHYLEKVQREGSWSLGGQEY